MTYTYEEGGLRVALHDTWVEVQDVSRTGDHLSLHLHSARTLRDLLTTMLRAVDELDATEPEHCVCCNGPISRERAQLALSRGQDALYCSSRCRNTAAKRRQRASQSP